MAALVDVLEVRAAPGEVFNFHAMLAGALPSAEAVMLYTSTYPTPETGDPLRTKDPATQSKRLPRTWDGESGDELDSSPRRSHAGGGDGSDPLKPIHSLGSVSQFESRSDEWVHRFNTSPSDGFGAGLENPFANSRTPQQGSSIAADREGDFSLPSSGMTTDSGSSGPLSSDPVGGEGAGGGSGRRANNLFDSSSPSPSPEGMGRAPSGPSATPAPQSSQHSTGTGSAARGNSPTTSSSTNATADSGSTDANEADGEGTHSQPDQPPANSIAQIRTATKGTEITLDARGQNIANARGVRSVPRATEDIALPYGMFEFEVTDVEVGGSATVEIVLHEGARADTYYKIDPVSGELFEFTFDGTTGAVIADNRITLHLVDGGRGDFDGVANGVIVDPGGPGVGGIYFAEYSGVDGFDGWEVFESGGSTQAKGTVTLDGTDLVLREGDSFLVGLEREVIIPVDPTILTFKYIVDFDTSTSGAINDAFEVALIDANGNTLTPTIRYERDSYFNITEGEPIDFGSDVEFYEGTNPGEVSG